MPKMIGHWIEGAVKVDDNTSAFGTERVRLSYSQARLLPPAQVIASLDTTDRGGPKSLAKRWYRWFASATAIEACSSSTRRMRELAILARLAPAARFFRNVAEAAKRAADHPSRKVGACLTSAGYAAHVAQVLAPSGLLAQITQTTDWATRHVIETVALDTCEQAGIDRVIATAVLYAAVRAAQR